ncbi:MAG: penicillin-binding protein 1B [Succinivibrio sp.]
MSNHSGDEILKGFSAIDEQDRQEAVEKNDGGRVEPTFDNSSLKEFDEDPTSNADFGNVRDGMSDNKKSNSVKNPKQKKSSSSGSDKKPEKKSVKKRFAVFSIKATLAAFVILALLFVYFDSVVLSKFGVDDKWVLPAVVYSRPLELYPEQKLSLKQMEYELKLLKYRRVKNPQAPGEYAVNNSKERVVILRRPFDFPDGAEPKLAIAVDFNGQRVSSIINADTREELGYVRMDPVLLDRINRIDPKEDRIFIQLNEVPDRLITTLLEIEDRSFKTNCGVNFLAIGRAFVKNFIAGSVVEGGSTITQQLVKNYFLNSSRNYTRKFKEIIMALIMNQRYSKDQILEAYLNEIYLGQNGAAGIYGFGLASYFYFGVPVSELSQEQMALLVGIIKGPSYYDPWRHPEKALERRNVVLTVLHKRGVINATEYAQYMARPLGVIKRGSMNYSKTPAFMGVLKKEIASNSEFGKDFLSGNGIKIFTSLDPQAQQAAEIAVEKELNQIERETGRKGLEAAMVVSSWRTAEVSAVVGSRTPQYEGFNRVMEGRRQVGSVIKPFVYLTAFHNGIHLGTMINDVPITVKLSNGKLWQPKNDDKQYHGLIPTYVAMARSMNIPTVKIGMRVGINHVKETLMDLGIKKERIPNYPSMLLGTIELTPFEVAQLYSSLATDGAYRDLTTLRTVVKDGKIVYERKSSMVKPTIDPKDSYLTLYVMMKATQIGTGRRIGRLFPNINIATKTGTTNDNRDTWTVGIDSDQVVATWVGFDDNKSTGLFGSSGAMRVYARFLTERGVNSLELKRPDGIKFVNFNSAGNIVADNCLIPGLNSLPARLDKIRYVEKDCMFTASEQDYIPGIENNAQ